MSAESSMAAIAAWRLERRKSPEFVKASIDLCARQCSEALHAELFAAEAAHHRTVNHGAMQFVHAEVTVVQVETSLGKISNEPARKAVPRSGRIENIFQQVARRDKQSIFTE